MTNKKNDIDKLVSSYKAPFKRTKSEAWNDIENSIENKAVENKTKFINWRKPVFSIAASFIGLVVISWVLISYNKVHIYVARSEKIEIRLPDNSLVKLNSDSYLSYSKLFWKINRKVSLNGEAYFSVMSGDKFKVESDIATVEVLGTEFNVFSRNNVFETRCFSGKVGVKSKKSDIVLTKGEAYYTGISGGAVEQFDFEISNNKDWRNGDFYFEKKSLQFVFEEIERQFNVKVNIPAHELNREYTGYFTAKDLSLALSVICLPMGLNYTIEENTVTINK
jgi:ferric-dicitrate binding protein FerR (iron transport regulator)